MSIPAQILLACSAPAEAKTFAEWLQAGGFASVRAVAPADAADDLRTRACDLLITDVRLAVRDKLVAGLRTSPRNRQVPLVLIGDANAEDQARAQAWRAYYVERPVDKAWLVCAASMAIAEGRPVQRSRRKTIGRFEAVVNGAPAFIVDVSKEGMQLEIQRDGRSPLPPVFGVRIPLVGVGLLVQRVWARQQSGGALICGGTVAPNQPKAEQGWHEFVEAVPTMAGR
jgi:CheY-like chemotaxis protein